MNTPNLSNLQEVHDELFVFIWNFKHGDNIDYNFSVLQSLYNAQQNSPQKGLLRKPITIQIVSIIEAILIDFLVRLDQATTHLPSGVSPTKIEKIKEEIEKDKKKVSIEDPELGKRILYKRRLYQFNHLVKIFEKYELFGPKGDEIYTQLNKFADMRNRVHIENYHGNLEEREQHVFTDERVKELEVVLETLWKKMVTEYKRPWK